MTPRTTLVIATRNRRAELLCTLGKLASLRPRPPIVVVDNGSDDDTASAVRSRARTAGGIRLIRLARNEGAAARNHGVAVADTPYVAFSDDDSWWAADALTRAERIFDAHPGVGLLAARTLVGPHEAEDPACALMAASPLGRTPGLPGPSVLGFLACSAVVRRQAFLDAGGFSPLLHFAGEETLLAYGLAARGWRLCYVDSVLAHHHPSAIRSTPVRRQVREVRNRMLVAWMRRPVPVAARGGLALAPTALRHPPNGLAGAQALGRLPVALAPRKRVPDEVERQIR